MPLMTMVMMSPLLVAGPQGEQNVYCSICDMHGCPVHSLTQMGLCTCLVLVHTLMCHVPSTRKQHRRDNATFRAAAREHAGHVELYSMHLCYSHPE
jgi:hypothetical protein